MPSAERFEKTLRDQVAIYDVALSEQTIGRLIRYYELLELWNARLHLVAPASPEEFATRHVLESLMLTKFFPIDGRVADVGSGGGLPIIPCLAAREDIKATLIDSSKKKCVFLLEALKAADAAKRASVIAERFENIAVPKVDFVTSRALERFTEMLPALVKWSPAHSTLLLFGGEELGNALRKVHVETDQILIPNSERRFLFCARKLRNRAIEFPGTANGLVL